MKKVDLIVKNAIVIDSQRDTLDKKDIVINNGIIEADIKENIIAEQEINAEGYFLSAGWVDSHVHVFDGGTEAGLHPDVNLIPMGITSVIDAGSCGFANWKIFKDNIVDKSILDIYYSLNVSPCGQVTGRYPENIDPMYYDFDKLLNILMKDKVHARGIKLRFGAEVISGEPEVLLDKVISLANRLNCSLTIHVTNPACNMNIIANKLRAGDIMCHVYHGTGDTILDQDRNIKSDILKARERGVFFDSADARTNHSYTVMKRAVECNFKPDIISTDLTNESVFGNMCWGLPIILSKWLNLGLSLSEVIKACTYTPAKVYKLNNEVGTLNNGAKANITIFKVINKNFKMANRLGESFEGEKMIVPYVTIIDGNIVYKNVEFPF